jgi:hypothetical protein
MSAAKGSLKRAAAPGDEGPPRKKGGAAAAPVPTFGCAAPLPPVRLRIHYEFVNHHGAGYCNESITIPREDLPPIGWFSTQHAASHSRSAVRDFVIARLVAAAREVYYPQTPVLHNLIMTQPPQTTTFPARQMNKSDLEASRAALARKASAAAVEAADAATRRAIMRFTPPE